MVIGVLALLRALVLRRSSLGTTPKPGEGRIDWLFTVERARANTRPSLSYPHQPDIGPPGRMKPVRSSAWG
jgi:hypothetical protein